MYPSVSGAVLAPEWPRAQIRTRGGPLPPPGTRGLKTGLAIVEAVRVRPALRREQAFVVELVGRRPGQYVGVAACVAARPVSSVRFLGVADGQLPGEQRA
jgi:hypothetical protein